MNNETRFTEKDGLKFAVKTLEHIDRRWFVKGEKCLVGDLSFTFEDAPESRSEELGELASNIKEYAGEDMVTDLGWDDNETREEDNIPIYYVYQSDFEEEVDAEDAEFRIWRATENMGTRKAVFIGVYASEKEAKALGIDKAIKKYEAECEITYLNPDTEIAKYLIEVEKFKEQDTITPRM